MMKIKDLLDMDICVDVYDNVCDDIAIAFEGGFVELTEEGEYHFADVLDYEVENLTDDVIVINIDYPDWKKRLEKAKEFFWSMAGYCSVEEWDLWFTEIDR